jgi:hypothetical protein
MGIFDNFWRYRLRQQLLFYGERIVRRIKSSGCIYSAPSTYQCERSGCRISCIARCKLRPFRGFRFHSKNLSSLRLCFASIPVSIFSLTTDESDLVL